MFSAFQTFGRMGATVRNAWSESALWPNGASSPGLWIDPSYPASEFQDSAGTIALSTVGTVLDSSNPVGLVLDRKAGATSKTDPGLHLSQSTSAARPVASGRVNLLTYSEDFSNAAWNKYVDTLTANAAVAPDGTATADFISLNQPLAYQGIQRLAFPVTGTFTISVYLRSVSGSSRFKMVVDNPTNGINASEFFDTTEQWARYSFTVTTTTATSDLYFVYKGELSPSKSFYAWGAQLNPGPTALPYQRVGAASDYTATGFPAYAKFDGTDDALASATFAAGTLTSSMDCLIAVRRDSAAAAIFGLVDNHGNKYFGVTDPVAMTNCYSLSTGTPTVWVDNIQLSGGTAVTRATLNAALTLGAWHILEFRGLDLSTWTNLGFSNYTGFQTNGALGGIELFASGQDANRDKARARMAAYFGVTLA